MKTLSFRLLLILFAACLATTSCKKDEAALAGVSTATLTGTWAVTVGEETYWEDGSISTPRALNPALQGWKMEFTATTVVMKDAYGNAVIPVLAYTLTGTTLEAGNAVTGLGVFTIKNFVAGTSMEWDQREPIGADYDEDLVNCGCSFSYQKFLRLAKM